MLFSLYLIKLMIISDAEQASLASTAYYDLPPAIVSKKCSLSGIYGGRKGIVK